MISKRERAFSVGDVSSSCGVRLVKTVVVLIRSTMRAGPAAEEGSVLLVLIRSGEV